MFLGWTTLEKVAFWFVILFVAVICVLALLG